MTIRCSRRSKLLNLIEQAIRWSTGSDPAVAGEAADPLAFDATKMTSLAKNAKRLEYVEAKIAFYPPGEKKVAVARGTRCSYRSNRLNR